VDDFLFTAEGRAYLEEEYVRKQRSTYAIARDRGGYANLINRALRHHGFARRSHSDAQKAALDAGRHTHPTRGIGHDQATKDRIGEAVSQAHQKRKQAE
jgi:hypothetical protein